MATPCKFCEKKGLPILPIRYGIGQTGTFGDFPVKHPLPDATKLLGAAEVPLNVPDTVYTGRILRGGYLYVFYEHHAFWEAYSVDEVGGLSILTLTDDTPPGGERFEENCKRDVAKLANASVVTIQDPATAGKVWFGFSDAWWTKAIRERTAGLAATEREKFMRMVDVGAWYGGGKPGMPMPKHTFQIYQVDMIVAEYAMPLTEEVGALGWSPFVYRGIVSADAMKKQCDALMPAKGLVLGLQDPVGLAQEIPAYMNARWAAFSKPWQRQTDLEANLTNLQNAVERQAETDLYNDRASKAQQNYAQLLNSGGTAYMLESYRKQMQPLLDDAKKVTLDANDLATARRDAWAKYDKLINPDKRKAYRTQYASASGAFDKKYMLPLGKLHAAWMQSIGMGAMFDHHFDASDINTGVGFTAVFAACVMGTGGYIPCLALYEKWLQGGLASFTPIWRALVFNHPELKAAVAQASEAAQSGAKGNDSEGDAPNNLPNPGKWAKLFSLYKTVISKIKLAGDNAFKTIEGRGTLAQLTTDLGPSLVRIIKKRGQPGENLEKIFGMHAGMPVQRLQVVGTRRDVYRAMHDALEKLQPAADGLDKADRAVIVNARMAILEAEAKKSGVSLDEKVRSWTLLLDANNADSESVYRFSSNTQGEIAANRVMSLGKAQSAQIVTSIPIESYLGRVLDFARSPGILASISMVFSTLGWANAQDAEKKALKTESGRVMWGYRAATIGLVAGMLDLVTLGIKSNLVKKLPLLGPLAKSMGGKFLEYIKLGGAGAGVVGMWIAVGIDTENVIEAAENKEFGIAALYFVRGLLEVGVAGALTRAFLIAIVSGAELEALGPPAWIATAIILVVTIAIDIFKDPPTLTWTRNCLWGPSNSFQDGSEEQADFKKATGG